MEYCHGKEQCVRKKLLSGSDEEKMKKGGGRLQKVGARGVSASSCYDFEDEIDRGHDTRSTAAQTGYSRSKGANRSLLDPNQTVIMELQGFFHALDCKVVTLSSKNASFLLVYA